MMWQQQPTFRSIQSSIGGGCFLLGSTAHVCACTHTGTHEGLAIVSKILTSPVSPL